MAIKINLRYDGGGEMKELDNFLQHHGIKGMKWGVRNDKKNSSRTSLGEKLGSLKRERSWKKVLNEIHNLSNEQLTTASKRIQMENDLKRLSKKSPAATKKDKADYVRRGKMSNEELANKLTRLRAKDQLTRAIKDASKEQRELGEKIVNAGGSLAFKYATTKSITPKDVFDAVTTKPKSIKDQAVKELIESISRTKASK